MAKRFGSVRQLPSGRIQAAYWHEGRRRTGPHTFRTKADAWAFLSTVETDLRRGVWIDPTAGEVLLRAYAEKWLEGRTLRPRTRELYQWLLDKHVLPELGSIAMSDLKTARIRSWQGTIAKTHPTTAAKAYRLLATICDTAVSDEVILRTPCRVQGAGTERAPERPSLSMQEVGALADAMPERMRTLVLLSAWCALRRGELLALRRRDVNVLRGTVRVERTAHHAVKDGAVTYGPPKTAAGVRTVAYPETIADAVIDHLARFVEDDPDALLFTGVRGRELRPHVLQDAWSKARDKVGRPEVHLHDLRHAGATWAAIAGATTRELMARLGHASPRAALIYQHATEDRDAAVAEAMAALHKAAEVVRIAASRPRQSRTNRARRGSVKAVRQSS